MMDKPLISVYVVPGPLYLANVCWLTETGVGIQVSDTVGNEYGRHKNALGEARMAFTSHADAAFDVCFESILEHGTSLNIRFVVSYLRAIGRPVGSKRPVELDVDIGADARDWSAIQAAEKLKPVEIELRRIEEVVGEIVKQMDYLRHREQKLRDTNESTNERVKYFALSVMATLIGLGVWQVIYLRAYFRSKHLI
jgi:hypothetical protein